MILFTQSIFKQRRFGTCPASSNNYKKDAIKTSLTNSIGTYNMLELATKIKPRYY